MFPQIFEKLDNKRKLMVLFDQSINHHYNKWTDHFIQPEKKNCEHLLLDGNQICIECGYAMIIPKKQTVNNSNRLQQFKYSLHRYQGLENFMISEELIHQLSSTLRSYHILNPSLRDTFTCLNFIDSKLVLNIHKIHKTLIGDSEMFNINGILNDLYEDFRVFCFTYDELFLKTNDVIKRKSFIQSDNLLYHLLKKYRVNCESFEFGLSHRPQRMEDNNMMIKRVFDKLKWNWD
jgi:hypothetical protein